MDYNKYSIFLEVARCNNISKAAKKLGYTQSGVSHTLKRLEDEFNLPLFYRSRNGAFLTPAGEELLPHITELVQSEENLHQMVLSLHDLQKGTLNIGTYFSISRNWLPAIIQKFKQDYPSIKINFIEGGSNDILQWVRNYEVDLGFLSTDEHEGLEWIPLATDPLMAVLPKDYPLSEDAYFPLIDFNEKTFIISAAGTDVDIHRTLRENHINPDIQYSAKEDLTILSMVEHHLGISLLPDLVLKGHTQSIKVIPVSPSQTRELGIAVPALNLSSPVTSAFIQYTKEYLRSEESS